MDNGPLGGRSVNEFALEARYRFGNFGIVPFFDAGQVYRSSYPQFSDIRFGVGIGGRSYTNFGPVRVDVAVPINRRPGESRYTLYLGKIGCASCRERVWPYVELSVVADSIIQN